MTVNITILGDRCAAETWRSCIENLRQGRRPRFPNGIAREAGQGEFGVSSQAQCISPNAADLLAIAPGIRIIEPAAAQAPITEL